MCEAAEKHSRVCHVISRGGIIVSYFLSVLLNLFCLFFGDGGREKRRKDGSSLVCPGGIVVSFNSF